MNKDIEIFLASSHPYAEASKRTYRDVLSRILEKVEDLPTLTAPELLSVIQSCGWGNARQRLGLAAIQKFLSWKFGEDHPARRAKIKRVEGSPQPAVDEETALKLFASFDPYTPKGARDLALSTLLLETALRESEACHLLYANINLSDRWLQVLRKGGQWKAAVFSDEVASHLDRWFYYRQRIPGRTFAFVHIRTGKGLTPEGLYNIVETWGEKINVHLSPHMFRRGFATLATSLTNTPERTIMEGGGWSDPKQIKTYTRTLRLETMRKHLIIPALGKR